MLYKDYFIKDNRIPVEFRVRKDTGIVCDRSTGKYFSIEISNKMKQEWGIIKLSKFKEGDKVIAIREDGGLLIGDILTVTESGIRIFNGEMCINVNNETKGPYYETRFELYIEPIKDVKKEEVIDNGWGFE